MESATESSSCSKSYSEEEYRGHLFDDAEAQKELDIARALSQVGPATRAAKRTRSPYSAVQLQKDKPARM